MRLSRGRSARTGFVALIVALLMVTVSTLSASASYNPGPLPDHWWKMNAGSGTTLADSGGSPDAATFTGVSGCLPGWSNVGLVTGSSHSVTGTSCAHNQWADVGTPISFGSSWSIEAWWSGTDGGNQVGLFASTDSSGSGPQFYINGAGELTVYDGAIATCSGSNAFAGGAHFLVGVKDAGALLCYFDGALVTSSADSNPAMGTPTCSRLLSLCGSGGPYGNSTPTSNSGHIATFHFALTPSQILAAYTSAQPGAASTLTMTPPNEGIITGQHWLVQLTSLDASGNDVTSGETYTYGGTLPTGGATCALFSGNASWLCTAATPGIYAMVWSSSSGLNMSTVFPDLFVFSTATRFVVSPPSPSIGVGQQVTFRNSSADPNGNNISGSDGWSFDTIPSGVTCGSMVQEPGDQAVTCSSTTAGSYDLVAHDAAGIPFTVHLTVTSASNPISCGATDVACWVQTAFNALLSLPSEIAAAFYNFLFVSPSGKSYIDTSQLTLAALIPAVDCRTGQFPTAADGIHCLPFPFSIPYDFIGFINLVSVSPIAPTFTLNWTFHYLGSAITVGPSVSVASILTDTTMSYVRDLELVIFILGTAFGTWRILQLVGVG